MKIKIIKNLKCLISVLLILSFIIPNYASSVPDENSFITKAEFDKKLSEFNSRLTAFEATINSKIDLQVSTYLDRNGIWSEKKQVYNEADPNLTKTLVAPDPVYLDANGKGGNTNFEGPWQYIEKIDKSGLLFGTYIWRNNGDPTDADHWGWGWTGKHQTYSNWRTDDGFVFLVNVYEEVNSIKTKKYANMIMFGTGLVAGRTGGTGLTCTCSLSPIAIETPFQIFVSKGSKIWWECQVIYHMYYVNEVTALTGAPNTLYIHMKQGSVY